MKTFIIIPTKGQMQAPGIAITLKNDTGAYTRARHEAMKLSRLSAFDGWKFM